jgi:cation-transporting P-type ATPase F
MSTSEVARRLEVEPATGLTELECNRRRELYGANRMTAQRRRSAWVAFLLQFHQPLIYILLAASVVTLVLGEYVDASVIFGVVLINAIVGYLQESKAEKAIDALARMVTTETEVRRDGRRQRLPSEALVPGDVVLLRSGDRVPADLRLILVRRARVDESALTGESVPVDKQIEPLPAETLLADRNNLCFTGTLLTFGQAEGVVFGTGDRTETGRIAELIASAEMMQTPLTRKIAQFSHLLLYVILGLAALTFVVGLAKGQPWVEMFMAAVALAVAAIPEGLPAAVTITLAIGVNRMARRRAIIRKLPAVETLGSTTVICSDKTGTLTQNQMTVQEIYAGDRLYRVSGSGYDLAGQFSLDGHPVTPESALALRQCLYAGVLCNDAQLMVKSDGPAVQGDPTEIALLVAAHKAGLPSYDTAAASPRIETIPFESDYRYMATLHAEPDGAKILIVKGAAEVVLPACRHQLDEHGRLVSLDRHTVESMAETMAARGLRVLAFASRSQDPDFHGLDHEHIRESLVFLGLQGQIDSPRPEAVVAVRQCQTAGIRVKMITGDHALTARAIATQIGLHGTGENGVITMTGAELSAVPAGELPEVTERTDVFARVAPEQKLRLVQALQARGHVVAMTGDGVNDAPALKQADIGVAMGISGTDVAKQAADMLLTDDNFASIEAAVEEGRGVFDNITKFIVWTLPTNFGEGLVLLAAILFGVALPILPVQLLWVNMSTALLLGLMLVFEPKEQDLMLRPPRDPEVNILTPTLLIRLCLVAAVMLAGAFGLFLWEQSRGTSLAESRTVALNVFVMVELVYLFNCRSLTRSVLRIGFLTNRWALGGALAMILAQLALTYSPLFNRLFHTAPLSWESWARIAAVALLGGLLVGLEKWFRARRLSSLAE